MDYNKTKKQLEEIKKDLQALAELEFDNKTRKNNNILEELDKAITHVRRSILEINTLIK